MEDLRAFASAFPRFCDRNAVRVPGRGALPSLEGARPFEMGAEHLAAFRVDAAKDPDTLPAMLKQGPEAVAFYVSFRLEPDRWGIYLRERGIKALQEEYHRILWRDLGKYADRDIGDVAERVEYSLVLDYLLTHARFHFLVDRTAAAWEKEGGSALYAPYQETWYVPPAKPVAQRPEDIGNLEEALANLDAFRTYINPSYGEGVALMVDGKLDPRNVDEWKAFFIGGRFAVEMANVFSRQPPGWKDFSRFLNRKTSVGSTNYVRIQYSYSPDLLERGQKELARRIAGGGTPSPDNPFKEASPEMPNVYLL
ncbi:MAG TPA: hypothetical protein HA326_06180 [Thermoplasmata archaeon]|nr:hypothetical protein [Thermoplasmata archaeon]